MRAAQAKTAYSCESCGQSCAKWLGRCPQCGEWNSMVEQVVERKSKSARSRAASAARAVPLTEVPQSQTEDRLATGCDELDRVLGGGLVTGSLILLGGEPGIGKSTLLCRMLAGIANANSETDRVLYVSGEESAAQCASRARRVGALSDRVHLLSQTNLESALATAEQMSPTVLAIDSIQTLQTDAQDGVPGSVGQVRDCAARLLAFAKQRGIATVIVGHVTKEGNLAGPKTLEHIVDTVLHFDGEAASSYRILRTTKNRFGSTHELAVFQMQSDGLAAVDNPSQLFLEERPAGAPGSVVTASAEGSRPILVEIQALVAPASAGVGRRTAAGVDGKRVGLLLAVLAQRASCDVLGNDVFVNVAGGARVGEPAADLGVACSIASSARGHKVDPSTVVFGEVGLAGEVRAVGLAEIRLVEAAKLGFTRCVLPERNRREVGMVGGLDLIGVGSVAAALDVL